MTQHITMERAVTPADIDRRFDIVVKALLPEFSREQVKRWIMAGNVRIAGRNVRPADRIRPGDTVIIDILLNEPATEAMAQPVAFPVICEDTELLVIDKPAGLVVHPGNGNADGTLMNGLLHYLPSSRALPRAGIVHRLDKDTSGLMVVAKTLAAYGDLVDQLKNKQVQRTYWALTAGKITHGGTVDAPVGRSAADRTRMTVTRSGKPAITHYRPLAHYYIPESAVWLTHVECRLETGRTHQIRVHMRSLDHPLIGDPTYGPRRSWGIPLLDRFPRQALHACALELRHPSDGRVVRWTAPLPSDLYELFDALKRFVA